MKFKQQFDKLGFVIISDDFIKKKIRKAKQLFMAEFMKKMSEDSPKRNRELIKRFVDHPTVSSAFNSEYFAKLLMDYFEFKTPVKCGPTVSHFTSNDKTGRGYGIPFHQDYPSMASSKGSLTCWLNLVDSNLNSHGIEIIPKLHKHGLLDGKQTDSGYILNESLLRDGSSVVPTISSGELLVMSSYLPHRTFVNKNFEGWKLSISQRFDDLNDVDWAMRGYENAYETKVNREMYLKK